MKSLENRYAKIFGAYDIRGVVGEELDSPMARTIAAAYADYLCPDRPGCFVIGHDGRWSSPTLVEAASAGLRESGHSVRHMGFPTTPMVYWFGAEGGFDGSIAVTASHLRPQHDRSKLCQRDGLPLSSEHGLSDTPAMLQQAPHGKELLEQTE